MSSSSPSDRKSVTGCVSHKQEKIYGDTFIARFKDDIYEMFERG